MTAALSDNTFVEKPFKSVITFLVKQFHSLSKLLVYTAVGSTSGETRHSRRYFRDGKLGAP
jgi:hypothetical protein